MWGIEGTIRVPSDWQTLPDRFERGIEAILPIDNPLELAMMFSLWSARELMKNGLDAISRPDTS